MAKNAIKDVVGMFDVQKVGLNELLPRTLSPQDDAKKALKSEIEKAVKQAAFNKAMA